jgi:hypothetical protein
MAEPMASPSTRITEIGGKCAPVLSPGRDQALTLQIPAYAVEFLVGQLEVLQPTRC